MEKPKPEFNVEELLQQLRAEETTEGWTIEELCEKAGWSSSETHKRRMRKGLRDWIREGKWECTGTKHIERYTIDGQDKNVPAYRPIK